MSTIGSAGSLGTINRTMTSLSRSIGASAAIASVSLLCILSGTTSARAEDSAGPSGVRLVTPPDDLEVERGDERVSPTRAQLDRVDALAANARWNRFGTPAVLSPTPGRHSDRVRHLTSGLGGTPEQAARRFLRTERVLFRLSSADVERLEVVRSVPLAGQVDGPRAHVVGFRQRFAYPGHRLPAGAGGLITVGLSGSRVSFVSSSAYGSAPRLPAARVSAAEAWLTAAKRLGREVMPGAVRALGTGSAAGGRGDGGVTGWRRFSVTGFAQEQQVRLVALGQSTGGTGSTIRPAYEVNVVDVQDGSALAATSFVDAVTGKVLARHDRVDHLGPSLGRSVPCAPAWGGCGVRLSPAPDAPLLTALLGLPAPRAGRAIDQLSDPWSRSGCDIGTLRRVHAATARTRIDALQRDMGDWATQLGFPSPGPLSTSVHSGALTGGYPTYLGRNNAVQVTLQDGLQSVGGHYLFEPVAGQWYGRCADGALDSTLVAHEYAHLLTERLVGGPDDQLTGADGELLAESWADLLAAEYLLQRGGPAQAAKATAIGGYVAGSRVRGVRNHAVSSNPLNATNRGYASADSRPDQWSDAEIWTAANWDLRDRLGARTWTRLLTDSLALQQGTTSMPDARDALLAADRLRFGGVHARRIWLVFAQRGLGGRADQDAGSATASGPRRTDTSPSDSSIPSFATPAEPNGTLRLMAADAGNGMPAKARLYLGRYSARSLAVADTDPLTARPSQVRLAPGRYPLTWSAPGYGMGRTSVTVRAAHTRTVRLTLPRNLASAASGATSRGGALATTTDTVDAVHKLSVGKSSASAAGASALIDDDESTVWMTRGKRPGGGVAVVDLSQPRTVRSVRVSALTGAADRFSALRRFAIEVCPARAGRDCGPDAESGWKRIYTSPADAFPAGRPRPVPADLTFRDFDVPDTLASAVRLVPLANQCRGTAAYHGNQSADPLTSSDCRSTKAARRTAVAELMVYDVDPAPSP